MAGRTASPMALKIVVTGPFGAGKTTLIETISEVPVVETEAPVTDSTRTLKSQTTVAMDFGKISVGDGLVLNLFGTPGQERFDFMWEILGEGMLGFIVMVDATRNETLSEGARILAAFQEISSAPFIIGVNKSEGLDPADEDTIRQTMGLDERTPVIPCDARDRDSVKGLLLNLCYSVAEVLESSAPVPS